MKKKILFLLFLTFASGCSVTDETASDADIDDGASSDNEEACASGTLDLTALRTATILSDPGESGTIATLAGSGANATDQLDADADGVLDDPIPALTANFDAPTDTAVSPDGLLYIIDWNGQKIRVLNTDGNVEMVTGTGFEGDGCETDVNADGSCPALSTRLNHMTDITFDSSCNLVIAAWHSAKIKLLNFTADSVMDLCGTGNRQYAGEDCACEVDGADVVSFDLPSSVVFGGSGDLFIADQANQIVRRLGVDGIVNTVVGTCPAETGSFGCEEAQGYAGDGGPAVLAKLNNDQGQGSDPQGKITMDADGNLYIADTENHVVRKVIPGDDGALGDDDTLDEIITTVVGTGEAGYSGDGSLASNAKLNGPRDVKIDADGNLFIADTENHCIRKVSATGIISTVAGQCGISGDSGDDGNATSALLNSPYGVELDVQGNLYIADTLNYRIRVVYE